MDKASLDMLQTDYKTVLRDRDIALGDVGEARASLAAMKGERGSLAEEVFIFPLFVQFVHASR